MHQHPKMYLNIRKLIIYVTHQHPETILTTVFYFFLTSQLKNVELDRINILTFCLILFCACFICNQDYNPNQSRPDHIISISRHHQTKPTHCSLLLSNLKQDPTLLFCSDNHTSQCPNYTYIFCTYTSLVTPTPTHFPYC